jgi:hypothetical protein
MFSGEIPSKISTRSLGFKIQSNQKSRAHSNLTPETSAFIDSLTTILLIWELKCTHALEFTSAFH